MRIHASTKLFAISTVSALVLGLTACTPTNFKPAHHTSAYDCKRLQNRGIISLDQERQCRMGQTFDVTSPQIQQ